MVALMLMIGPGFAADGSTSGTNTPIQLPPISVEGTTPQYDGSAADGYRVDSQSMTPLGKQPLQDTPYTINVTPGELIENTGAHSMSEALATNPTIFVPQSTFTDARGMNDALIRGFKPTYLRDGLYVNSYNMPSVEEVDRIEVLNGLSSFFYGYNEPGGAINYVTRQPTTQTVASVKTGTYGGGQVFGDADVGGAIPGTNEKISYRLDAFTSGGGTFIDHQDYDSNMVSAKLAFAVTPDTVITPHFYHNDFREQGAQVQFQLAPGVKVPSTLDPSKLYGQPWTLNTVDSNQGGLGIKSQLMDNITFRADYNYSDMMWTRRTIRATLLDNSEDYSEQYRNYGPEHYICHTGYALTDIVFDTASIRHTVTFGYWGQNEDDHDAPSAAIGIGTFNAYAPTYTSASNLWVSSQYTQDSGWYYNSAILGDKIEFNDQWSAIVGASDVIVHEVYTTLTTGTTTEEYTDRKITPSLSLIYKPLHNLTTYASYMQGLEYGDQAPSTAANANQILAPSASEQYEVGVKTTVGAVELNTALFRINKVNAELDPNDNVYKQDGREIHQGLEVTATGKVTGRLTLLGGFTLMDASVSRATADPLTDNKIPLDVPERMASAHAEYALPFVPDLFVSGGGRYTGRRPVDAYNTQFLDENVIFDAGLRYAPEVYGHKISLNLNVSNLLDTRYWESYTNKSDSSGLQFGAPRLVSLSLKATW